MDKDGLGQRRRAGSESINHVARSTAVLSGLPRRPQQLLLPKKLMASTARGPSVDTTTEAYAQKGFAFVDASNQSLHTSSSSLPD